MAKLLLEAHSFNKCKPLDYAQKCIKWDGERPTRTTRVTGSWIEK